MKIATRAFLPVMVSLALSGCGAGGSSSEAENTAPTISGTPDTAARVGREYHFTPSANDTDDDKLSFSIRNKPDWASFDVGTGGISGVPESSDTGLYSAIAISVKDPHQSTDLASFDLEVIVAGLTQNNLRTEGKLTQLITQDPTVTAFLAEGTTTISVGEIEQPLENSSLQIEYDAEGNLIDLFGETDLPPALSNNLAINSRVKSNIGMYTGAEINATPDFGITLQDETNYLVFFVGTDTDITLGNADGSAGESITLKPPLSGKILFISDPTDIFYYYFAAIPFVGEAGYGQSVHGLIPFIPQEEFAALDEFNGHRIEKAKFGIGLKIFDLFEIAGTRITRFPVPGEIDWNKPLESDVDFKAGLNGDASFSFGILSVGLFEFDLASASATIDVGLDRQHFAMQTTIAPDVSWQPDWFPLLPTTEIVGNWVIDGQTGFSASLQGTYQSTIPPADLEGTMRLDNDSASFSASINHPQMPISMSLTFADDETIAELTAPVDLTGTITDAVNQDLDAQLANVEQAIDDLTDAISGYEFEVSLRGLRQSLPTIANTAINLLNKVPGEVRNQVDSGVVSALRSKCFAGVCASAFVNETAIGDQIGGAAKNTATTRIAPFITALETLKMRAQQADDAALRNALKAALDNAYAHRILSIKLKYSKTVDFGFIIGKKTFTVFDKTISRQVIPVATANKINFAASNVHRIAQTSNIVFNTQTIVDALPTKQIIKNVKQEIQAGLAKIPTFKGAGYTVSGNNYVAYILLDDDRIAVPFNVLSPEELLEGVTQAVSKLLLGS